MTSAVAQEVWAHPYSFARDPGRWADELLRSGISGVRLAHVYHSGHWLLSTTDPGRSARLESGSWFAPDPELALPWPVVHPDLAVTVSAALRASGLRTTAWVVGLHSGPAARNRPNSLLRNAFGDHLSHALCPADPQVVADAAALLGAVADTGAAAIELEAFGYLGWEHQSAHRKQGVPLRPADRWLLSLCLCRHCAAAFGRAEVDVVEVGAAIRQAVHEQLRQPREPADEVADDLAAVLGPSLPRILAARAAVVRTLLTEVRTHVPTTLRATTDPFAVAGRTADDPAALAALVDGLTLTSLTGDLPTLTGELRQVLDCTVSGDRLTLGWAPTPNARTAAREVLELAQDNEVGTVCWYAFDLALPSTLLSAAGG